MFDKEDDVSPGVLTLLWMSPLAIGIDWEQRKYSFGAIYFNKQLPNKVLLSSIKTNWIIN